MLAPDRTVGQRVGDLGAMLSETAGVVAPAMVAGRAAMPVAQAVQEGLLGFSMGADDMGRRFVERMNQPGPVPTMYSNPVGFSDYLKRVNPRGVRVAAEGRPNLMMGDMYGMLPSGAKRVGKQNDVTFYRGKEGDFYATAFNPDVGEQDVVGYIMPRGDMTELAVVDEMQGKGIGGELQYLFRKENPNAPTGGLTEAGEKALRKTYERLLSEGIVDAPLSPSGIRASLPAPRNEAEAMAKRVLDMRAAGRAGDVTEEMMAAADPQYMFFNTPLPMDEASRMARKDAMYGKDRYHGSNMDFTGFSGNVFTSDNPTVASTYNRGMLDAQIYPVVTREGPMGTVNVEGGLSNWNQLLPDMIDDPAIARELNLGMPISTRDIERQAAFEGRSGVTFKDINDLGPGFNSQQFKGLGYTPEQEEALRLQYLRELSVPSEVDVRLSPNLVRSRFARFDPEFRHLRNLSAGIGGLGLLSYGYPQEEY
jgi:GNAT superfamily N-acetyltransferase